MASIKKKKKEQSAKGMSFTDFTKQQLGKDDIEAPTYKTYKVSDDEDIAPVKTTTKKDNTDKWFKKGAFGDGKGTIIGDTLKTVGSTVGDVGVGLVQGIGNLVEGVVDLGAYGIANSGLMSDADSKRLKSIAQEKQLSFLDKADDFVSKNSLLGDKADMLTEGLGGVALIVATGGLAGGAVAATGASAATTGIASTIATTGLTGLSSWGSGMTEAYTGGATDKEAATYGFSKGVIDAGTELLFGGLGKGVKALGVSRGIGGLDDMFAKSASSKLANWITNPTVRTWIGNSIEGTIKAGGEGVEEVLAGLGTAFAKKLTYLPDEDLSQLVKDESLLDQFIVGFLVGEIAQSNGVIQASKQGQDFVTGLNENEQKVIDKVYENAIAKQEADGKKLTAKEKSKLFDTVQNQLERGEIDIDTIEEVLGGESYTTYKNAVDNETALKEEFDTLNKMKQGEMTGEQIDRRAELKQQLEELKNNSNTAEMKTKLGDEVFSLVKDSKLAESYNQRAKRGQAFTADLSQYDTKYHDTIKKAVDSGILNDTRRTHEFVDLIAKVSADKGVLFDFTNNENLANSRFAVEGATVNGYVDKATKTIGLNIDSNKALEKTVGHEITHVLEDTDFYDTFAETITKYAKAKGDYDGRFANLTELYKNEEAYQGEEGIDEIKKEVVADLVGDYLFTDTEFINRLSTQDRNLFQKIYDEIKYLCKVATAGSKEARELERVKKAFEDAYRNGGTKTESKGDVKHSLSNETQLTDNEGAKLSKAQQDYFKDSKMRDDNGNLKVMYHGTEYAGFHEFNSKFSDDDKSFFFVDRNDVAQSYSGSSEVYTARSFNTVEEFNQFFEEIDADEFEVIKQGDKFALLENGDVEVTSDTLKGLYEEFCDYTGLGQGQANYKVYLNLTNPLIVDGKGRPWNKIDAEFSQEVYDKYQSLTTEEKEALYDLAEWEDFSLFNQEIQLAKGNEIASAYKKLGEYVNKYDLFSIASDNFSENSLKEYSLNYLKTRDFAQRAKEQGYDGVIFKNIIDNGGYSSGDEGASTVAVAFESNQIKSVANDKPTGNADIRYSLTDIEGKPIDNARISSNEADNKYSLSHNEEIAKGQSDYIINHRTNVTAEELAEAQKVTAAMVDVMMKYSNILPEDKIGKVLTKNGSYDRSVENTTICVRTLAYNEFVDKVQEEIGRPLTQMESFLVSQKLYDIATEPQCLYCYVSLDRKAFNDMLLRYMNERDTVIAKYNNSDKSPETIERLYEEFRNGRKNTDNMRDRFNAWLDYVDNGTQLLSLADIATESRQSEINANGGILAEQLKDARKYAQSASWSKIQKDYVAYRDEILKLGDRVVKNLNEHYGMRWYSFSDYSAAFIVENMQQITDASIRGLKGLSYTKDTDYAEIFAPSGMNINISVFVNQDANGNFYIDEKQSANFEKAKALREQYPNVGIVATVTNDEALRWAGEQDWTDVIIPFHIVRTGTDVAEYYKWLNYTGESADKVGNQDIWNAYLDSLNLKSDNARKKVSKNIYPSEHKNDKATYLALCESRGLSPRFVRFAGEDWYMKLVNETRLSADDSSTLKPVYNLDAAQSSFQKFVEKGGYEGGWYKEGVDVDSEARAVADDVLAGKKANEVTYGRQDGFVPEDLIAGRKTNRKHGQHSLSEQGAKVKKQPNLTYGEDVKLDIAPTVDTSTETANAQNITQDDDFAPVYDAPATEEQANEMASEYLDSLTDDDAPIEVEDGYYNIPDTSSIDDKTLNNIGKSLRDTLSLTPQETKAIQEIVQEYSTSEAPSREGLFDTIKEKFAEKHWKEKNNEVADVKRWLRTSKISVSPEIKTEMAYLYEKWSDFRKKYGGRIGFSQNGIGVDSAYQELSEMYPDFFPADIINPAEQLSRMAEVADMEIYADNSYTLDDDTIQEAVNIITSEVRGYKDNLAQKAAEETARADLHSVAPPKAEQITQGMTSDANLNNSLDNQPIKTVKERLTEKLRAVESELADNKQLRREAETEYNAEIARLSEEYAALKDKSTKKANNLVQRVIRLERLKASVDADYAKRISDLEERQSKLNKELRTGESPTEQGVMRAELHKRKVDDIKSNFAEKGFDFDDVLQKAKDLSTFATVDNTPQRVMEKALGYKQGQILADETVNKVAENETEGIKWLNSFTDRKNGTLAQLSKKYNIKPGSKESAAAQMYAEGFYVDEKNEIVAYGDAELAKDFPDAKVRENIKGLAKDPMIRQIYDDTLAKINESRARNAYPEIQKLDNYFLHFRAMSDTFSKIGLPFNPNDIKAKDLPTDLNGVTADLKPGQPFFASAMHRKGQRTSFDLLGGLEQYLSSAKNQIYHIDDIQTLRALRNYIAESYGQANGLENLDALSEEEQQEKIKQVFNAHLSTFAKFLNEEANVIAGKTALIDRGVEGIFGRRALTFMNSVRKQVGSNMIGFNASSSLTNFLAGVQAIAKTDKASCVKSLAQLTSSKIGSIFGKTDSFVENNPTIIRRKGADRFYRTPYQKVGDAGYVLMSAVDDVTTEFIVRAKYNEFIKQGMSEEQAITEADKWTSRLMGDRSLGQMPQIYNSKTLGLITQFQLEVRNQLDSQFYDTIQEAKASNEDIQNGLKRNAKTAAKVTKTFFELAVLQHLFGKGFEAIAGYNPAFDIIGVLATALGFDDDEDSEDTALDNIEQGFLELLEDLPYTSIITNGGRIPISSALPITELIKGEDEYGNEVSRWDTLKEVAPYYVLPTGYGQIKKTKQGLSMFNTDEDHPISGSYTDSGALRFPVDDTLANRVQAGIFGQWANKNARDYIENGRKPLNEKQTQEFVDVDLPIADYWNYRDGLKGLKTLEEKAEYINGLDIEDWQKNLLINNIADRKEDIDMTDYDDYGSFDEFDYASKNPEKYAFFKDNGISYEDYANADEDGKAAYTWAYNNPEKFTLSKAVADDVVTYRQYTGDLYDIKADKDANGDTITGTGKAKKLDYINSLDELDYGQKCILYRSLFDSKDDKATYNPVIIDYLNEREDISYEEMITILEELDMTVDESGNIYWD